MKSRKQLLQEMRIFENPAELDSLLNNLAEYPWDTDEKFINIAPEHIITILRRYLNEEISAKNIEDWANAFEVRDDTVLGETEREERVFDAIYILANPVLEGNLTPKSARALIEKLSST